MHLADAFIKATYSGFRLYIFMIMSMCVPWELNPQPFALLKQCPTTEPQEHTVYIYTVSHRSEYTPHIFVNIL